MSDQSLSASERAPAKVNLTLHVTGQRADGYHLLDSLVVFVDVADRITVRASERLSLEVTGPQSAGVPDDARNLVWKAAEVMGATGHILLEKSLPAAAGIGGGSSDAAACMRGLARLLNKPVPEAHVAGALGADIPVCLNPVPQRMRGVGDQLEQVSDVPAMWIVLVNPRLDVPTPAVFRALQTKSQPPMAPILPKWSGFDAFAEWLATQRNDLQPPAIELEPVITTVLEALGACEEVRLARMSGSGATCFGLCQDSTTAAHVAAHLHATHPDWWVAAGQILLGSDAP